MAYNGSIDLISGIRPKNNGTFPLVDAKDVYVTDDKRLDVALDEKADAVDVIPKPADEGTTGQILRIDEEGTPAWSDVGTPTEEQVGDAVDAWLTAHPEATTTVQDGTISYNKLDVNLKGHADAIAPTEATATASRAYAVGDHFFLGGVLYEATAAIASGGSIVTTGEGVNVQAVPNLSEQLGELKSAITEPTYNLVSGTIEKRTITATGQMQATNDYDMQVAPVEQGKTYTVKTDDTSGLVCGFFVSDPSASGATSYNNSRTIQASTTIEAPISGYIAFRTSHGYAQAQIVEGHGKAICWAYYSRRHDRPHRNR